MNIVLEQFHRAENIWDEITKLQMNFKKNFDYSINKIKKEIDEAKQMDKTYFLPLMILEYHANCLLKNAIFTYQELINNKEKINIYIKILEKLVDIFNEPQIVSIKKEFSNNIIKALNFYEARKEDAVELANDPVSLSFLYLNALKAKENLTRHKFLSGIPEDKNYIPQYAKHVYEYWNINSLVKNTCTMPSGVTLNLIRDKQDMSSYFCFAIKNGGNIWVITDKPKYPNPIFKYKTRRPERGYKRRAYLYYFPYDLLNISYETGTKIYEDSTNIVPYQKDIIQLKRIADLDSVEIIWTAMMFNILCHELWGDFSNVNKLSYTGEMFINPNMLIETQHNLSLTTYNPIQRPMYKEPDLTHKNLDGLFDKPTYKNDWMIEKYNGNAKHEVLNLFGFSNNDTSFVLDPETLMPKTEESSKISIEKNSMKLLSVSPTEFGSKEE
jgi:hypothetical protein